MTKKVRALRPSKGLRVGVTLFVRDANQSLWENGIFQNCYFLLQLLNKAPGVAQSFVVASGSAESIAGAKALLEHAPSPVISFDEAMESLDIVIELSAQLNGEWAAKFKTKGGKLVAMHVANDYVIDMERMVFDLAPGMLVAPIAYDVAWTLPAFEKTCRAYYQTLFRTPTHVMQHLWSPYLLEATLAKRENSAGFFFKPPPKRWRLGVFEPNICTVKTNHIPLLLADTAYRKNRNMIENLRLFSTTGIRENPSYIAYARQMDMVQHGIAHFEDRYPIYDVLPQLDAVISHHQENAQNYLYYEILYAGYPLIHNSDLIEGCGYRYNTYDTTGGAEALSEAYHSHVLALDGYKRRVAHLLHKLNPLAPHNIETYNHALVQLYNA